jgi:putative serine protease PepD
VTGQFSADTTAASPATSFGSIGKQSDASVSVPVSSSTVTNPDWQAVSAAVAPAVVAIQVTSAEGTAEGSGVIIDGEGHILTNDHVVSGAQDGAVHVTLDDGRLYDATIVGLDPATDLAVIALVDPPSDLKSAVFADSNTVVVGEPVMAMGNPLGLSNTATTGIVSAIDRPVNTGTTTDQTSVVTNAIQIDAAINPGNSGGPLFNASGEVIGITSSIASVSSGSGQSGSIGLGFAIPASLAQNIGSQLMKNGSAEHAFLGLSLDDGTGTVDGTTRQGAVVKAVTAGSPAAEAALQPDDVIVAIDDAAVTGAESLTGFVRALPSGHEVTLTVVRDGKALDVQVTLATKTETTTQSGNSDGSSGSGQQDPSQDQSVPGSDNPRNIPGFPDLLPGQNG